MASPATATCGSRSPTRARACPLASRRASYRGAPAHPRHSARGRAGLGLGLAIASQLVLLHGGSIELRSPGPSGSGTVFSFSIPTIPAPRRRTADRNGTLADGRDGWRRSGPRPSTRTPTVLIVDDDPDILDLHARVVAEAGGRASCVRTARTPWPASLAAASTSSSSTSACPGVDGFEVIDRMRAEASMRDIPIIVVTGRALADDDLERLRQGVVDDPAQGRLHELRDGCAGGMARMAAGFRQARPSTSSAVRWRSSSRTTPTHLTREDIARHVAISPDYLTDWFRQELGVTPMTYLTRCRIRPRQGPARDDRRLDHRDRLGVGFADVSHFTRTFHREVGVSPRAYRQGASPFLIGIDQEHPVRGLRPSPTAGLERSGGFPSPRMDPCSPRPTKTILLIGTGRRPELPAWSAYARHGGFRLLVEPGDRHRGTPLRTARSGRRLVSPRSALSRPRGRVDDERGTDGAPVIVP